MQILYHRARQKASIFNGFWTFFLAQTVVNPVTGRWAFGCSICSPSMSQRYCCGVSVFTSDSERGHWYAPCSSRLYSRMKPPFSQYKPLIRSRRRPQNKNNHRNGYSPVPASYVPPIRFKHSAKDRKRRHLVVKTKYRLFLVALLHGSYPMPVMSSYCLIEGHLRRVFFVVTGRECRSGSFAWR